METKSIFVGFTVAPSIEDIEGIAKSILDELPRTLRKHIYKMKVQVEDFPDAFIEEQMETETSFDLLGCYQSSAAVSEIAGAKKKEDILYIYRRPILDAWAETHEDLTRMINRVMIQEIGLHFGHSLDEIEMYEEDMFGATVSSISAG